MEPKRFKSSESTEVTVINGGGNMSMTTLMNGAGGNESSDAASESPQSSSPPVSISNGGEVPVQVQVSQNGCSTSGTEIMSISNVLDHTLRYLSAKQLKSFRLVNKQWDNVATKVLQDMLDPIVFTDEFYDADKMRKVVETFKKSNECPHVKFEIASKFFTLENEDLIREFFRICGPFMFHLTICADKNRDSKFKFAEELLTTMNLPHLKSLIIEDHTPHGVQAQYNHDFSMFFKALIAAANNLERLDLSFPKRFLEAMEEEAESGSHIPQLPDGIICSRSSQNLKHLEISAKITDCQMVCLSKSGLSLATLHFRIKNVSLLETSFTALLESQSDSLLELKLTEERHGSNFLVRFPRMNRLKKITIISICEFENSSVTFAPFGYQDQLPSMEALVLWNCFGKEERWSQFFLAETPSLTLTRLDLPVQFRNLALARNISVVFPVLKKLKIGFSLRPENEEVMKTLFEGLSSLEELAILTDMDNQNENIDHILTGIPKNHCRVLKNEGSFREPNCLDGIERGASLINLKNLRRLDIILDNNRAPFITDVTGYLAFMHIPKLRILRFTRYGMSQECVDDLMKKFRVEFIPPHGRNFFEVEYLNLDDFD